MAGIRLAALIGLACVATPAWAAPRIDGLLGDHAVIQRGQPIRVSGTAAPGEQVTLSLAGESADAKAGPDGSFRATLGALPAGGPFELVVAAKSGVTTVRDLLVGDVFLCSGQSNMEMAVERSGESFAMFGSADDQLRLITIAHDTALEPRDSLARPASWSAAAPATVGPFSAACYYMVQDLRRTEKVPIGAILSSWSGSRISPWIDEAGLREAGMGDDVDMLNLYKRDATAGMRAASTVWEAWWRAQSGIRPGAEPWQPEAALEWQPVPRLGTFGSWGVAEMAGYHGLVWFRNEVTLTAAQAGQQAVLSLGALDDADHSWVNGKPIGGSSNSGTLRTYLVPPGTLTAGRNVITVNIDNDWLDGGMLGPAEAMKLGFADGSSIPLASGWRYSPGGNPQAGRPKSPWDDIRGAGIVYNAMIAPLGQIALAGVAWYQGESDAGIARYDRRLLGLMHGWRRQFGADLPFAIVQLPNFGATATAPVQSGWATLRDEQRRAVAADGHAALAVTIDIGDPLDLHPAQKHEVGRRLARAMRALVYHQSLPPSGPRIAGAERASNGDIILHFSEVTGALATRSGSQAIGFELCDAGQSTCRFAAARASGTDVLLTGDGKPATRVRYAWSDSPVVNLFDGSGVPVGPFEVAAP